MANEKRLIDANALIAEGQDGCITDIFPKWDELPKVAKHAVCDYGRYIKNMIQKQPTVDAVPVEQYNALLSRCEGLREDFVDYVCSGSSNPAVFCKNKFAGCVDRRGWCMQTNYCRGFSPDGERKDND